MPFHAVVFLDGGKDVRCVLFREVRDVCRECRDAALDKVFSA